MPSRAVRVLALGSILLLPACGQDVSAPPGGPPPTYSGPYGYGAAGANPFKDDVQTNSTPKLALKDLSFANLQGESVPLKNYVGAKNLVLVVTRGHLPGDALCLMCSTQTSGLIANYDEVTKRDAQVVVVFPVSWGSQQPQFDAFVQAAKRSLNADVTQAPFPVLVDLQLNAVKNLEIEANLSKPATYIIDRKGQVRFAYVGENMTDRPSMKAILKQLDDLQDKKRSAEKG